MTYTYNFEKLHELIRAIISKIEGLGEKRFGWTFDGESFSDGVFGVFSWEYNHETTHLDLAEVTIYLRKCRFEYHEGGYSSRGEALLNTLAHELRHVWQLYYRTHEAVSPLKSNFSGLDYEDQPAEIDARQFAEQFVEENPDLLRIARNLMID